MAGRFSRTRAIKQINAYLNDLEGRSLRTKGRTGSLEDIVDSINEILETIPLESGFENRVDSVMSFDDGTLTFSIEPTSSEFSFFQMGEKYTKTALESVAITDVEGLHFIYYDDGVLTHTTTFMIELITEFPFTALIYWDATNNEALIFGDERHGHVMDAATHRYNHLTFGARYDTGLGLANMDVDGNGNDASAAQFAVENGVIWDEDIQHTILDGTPQDLSPIAQIPIFYREGANGDWRREAADDYPIITTGSGRAAWNEFTGGAWQLSEVGNGDFVLVHYYATNDSNHPIIGIVGQAEYPTTGQARAGALEEIKLLEFGVLGTLTPEFVAIATVIYQTRNNYSNAVKSRVRSTDTGEDYVDWRTALVGTGGSGGFLPSTFAGAGTTGYVPDPVSEDETFLKDDGTFGYPGRIASTAAPSSASDTGSPGEIRYDSDYIYICVATDTWKRAAIATWA